jgi:ATP-dependent DNA ligase
MKIPGLPAGFVIPAQPVLASRPPSSPDWVHEIKHDGYRMIVHRDGATVRLYSRNAYDWTERLAAISAAAERINAKSFTIDGEAVVVGLMACHGSRSCPVERPLEPRSSTRST